MKHPRTRVAVIDVVALSLQMMEHMPRFSAWAGERSVSSFPPAFPALTCSAQSTYVTGLSPREHAIPGNGWYNRNMCEIQFWKQSNKLVQGPRLWEKLRERYGSGFTCAKLFWWYNMYSTADWTITPRPMYPADGRKIFDIYTQPMELRETIKKDLGEFPFPTFWGPMAGIRSSQWIADSARWIERKHRPDLSLIYLPYLDYDLQKFGPSSTQAAHAAEAMEMGASACLVNTAIAVAGNPIEMAKAFKQTVEAGRTAYEAGLGMQAIGFVAEASSPLTAFLNE